LTFIAGHLLSLAPEEDAFWIFVSVMNTHLRPYFSQSSMQLEVDASLFSKALEANDPSLARKIFVDLGITPGTVCRQWFVFPFLALFSDPIETLSKCC
jgi:TBC1 domain family member 10